MPSLLPVLIFQYFLQFCFLKFVILRWHDIEILKVALLHVDLTLVQNNFYGDSGDTQVELGARWIHGVLGNPLYEFAVSQGLVGLNDQASMQHNVVVTTERGSQVFVI